MEVSVATGALPWALRILTIGPMSILKVARMGHPVLREVAREVTRAEISSEPMQRLVCDMLETMEEYGGVGLAAPQVHAPIKLALIEFDPGSERYEVDEEQPCLVCFNPKVMVLDPAKAGFWEGCLSVPGLRGYVERPTKVQVDYLDERAEPCSIVAEGFLATVIQHELDHLDGKLFVDYLSPLKRQRIRRKLEKQQRLKA